MFKVSLALAWALTVYQFITQPDRMEALVRSAILCTLIFVTYGVVRGIQLLFRVATK